MEDALLLALPCFSLYATVKNGIIERLCVVVKWFLIIFVSCNGVNYKVQRFCYVDMCFLWLRLNDFARMIYIV